MKVRPFLYFNGNCQDAIDLYEKAFNVKAYGILRFCEAYTTPEVTPIPEHQKNWICCASIMLGNNTFRLVDSKDKIELGGLSRACIEVEGEEDEIIHAYSVLEKEGTVVYSLQQAIFLAPFHNGDFHGSVIDKFGVRWELSSIGWDSIMFCH